MECSVLHLLANVGDKVSVDDSVLEVATDKVDTEVPCPFSGVLTEWLVKEGDMVPIGSAVAKIEVENDVSVEDQPKNDPVEATADVEATAAWIENDYEQAIAKKSGACVRICWQQSGKQYILLTAGAEHCA